MPVSDETLDVHLERFGEALANRDAAASAALWNSPGILVRDDLAAAFTSEDEVAEGEAPDSLRGASLLTPRKQAPDIGASSLSRRVWRGGRATAPISE